MRYKAICQTCNFKSFDCIRVETAQEMAEHHMMKSGHIVDIKEV